MGIADIIMAEYGVEPTCEGARRWNKLGHPPELPRKYLCPETYVEAVRRIMRRKHLGWVDWRLLAVGFCKLSPADMVGLLPRWLGYWQVAANRPETVGSSHNTEPREVFQALQLRVPPQIVRAGLLGHLLRGRDRKLRRPSPKSIRRFVNAARAACRASYRKGYWQHVLFLSMDALSALGRLCPELQRIAISSIEADDGVLVRARDLPWEEVARVQRLMVADPRVRVAIVFGEGDDARCFWSKRAITLCQRYCPQVVCIPAVCEFTWNHSSQGMYVDEDLLREWLCPTLPEAPLRVILRALIAGVGQEELEAFVALDAIQQPLAS